MGVPTPGQPLVRYEFAVKPARRASANFRWEILRDGRYLRSQNPPGSVRPAGFAGPYWYAQGWQELLQLTGEQVEGLELLVEAAPLREARISPATPSRGGNWARLTLARSGGTVVFEVEDGATGVHEEWLGRVLALLAPVLAARRGGQVP